MAQTQTSQTPPGVASEMSATLAGFLAHWSGPIPPQVVFKTPTFESYVFEDLEPDQRVRLSGEW